jgi:hypothetical protein
MTCSWSFFFHIHRGLDIPLLMITRTYVRAGGATPALTRTCLQCCHDISWDITIHDVRRFFLLNSASCLRRGGGRGEELGLLLINWFAAIFFFSTLADRVSFLTTALN